MKAKRKLTLSITLVAALLMALLTAGTALAGPGSEEVIDVVGTVLGWNEVDFTIDLEVEIISEPPVDPPLTEILTILVGEDFDFMTIAVGDILEVSGGMNDEDILVVTDVKIQERIRDRIRTQECEGEECDPYFCAVDTDKVHPVAEKIALTYGVPYETILGLLCEGDVSLGQIMLALQTAALAGEEVDFMLYLTGDMDEFHWGQIWNEMDDITGKPGKGVAPGQIQDGDGEGNDEQGQKNKDGEEECDGVFCEVYKWLQKGKK